MSAKPSIDSIFCSAIEIESPDERRAHVEQACGDDMDLKQQVERLLHAHFHGRSILDAPVQRVATIDEPLTETAGTVIGPYKLLEQIGEGGMGTVWMAQQTEPVKRLVALKLIKAGMDSKQVIARFEAERQALALMDHPNIAKVLDGGTTASGWPFFAMDLVKGVPITKYCDERHLTPRQRLELFIPVCQAVQHAHQKGIIHRDLKPSNVLVALYDGRPVPKVIDFGVAKAAGQSLTDKTLVTGFGNIVGTLEYMSPEQAEINQLDIDTRSDIYSLGVLLYELLTGSPPFTKKDLEKAGMLEMLRVIREEEPSKPSTKLSTAEALPTLAANRGTEPTKLTKLMRGELDWIVMKALEKDRSRRYETANGFAKDVQRHLSDEAVLACPPSAGYRLKKFARRNRGRLALGGVLCLALLAVLATAAGSIGWIARDRAERQARLNGQVELILDDVDRLAREQKWREAQAALEQAEAVMAGGEPKEPIGQRVRESRRDLQFVVELDRIRQARAATVGGKLDNAGARQDYARAFRDYGVDIESLPATESVARLQRKPALIPPLTDALDTWAHSGPRRWKVVVTVARGLDPNPLRDRIRATWGRPVTPELQAELRQLAESIDATSESPTTVTRLAISLESAKLRELAIRILKESQFAHPGDFWLNLELGRQLNRDRVMVEVGGMPTTTTDLKDLGESQSYSSIAIALRPNSAAAHNNLGSVLMAQRRYDDAITRFQSALDLDAHHAAAHLNLGLVYFYQKNIDQAVACMEMGIALDPNCAMGHNNLGIVRFHCQNRVADAVACYQRAIELDPEILSARMNLGRIFMEQGKLDDAIACFRKAAELDPKKALNNLGVAYTRQKKFDEMVACFKRAIELNPNDATALYNLGLGYVDFNKRDDAIGCFRKVIEIDPKYRKAYYELGMLLRAQRKLDDAIVCYRKVIELDPNHGSCHFNLGLTLLDSRKFEAAVPCFERAIALRVEGADGRNYIAESHNNVGYALLNLGKPSAAIPHLEKAIDLNPKRAFAHGNLGIALAELKKPDEAIKCFRKAIELNPKYVGAHHCLGLALQSLGKLDLAIAENREALRLDPNERRVRTWLIDTLSPLGRLEELRASWEQALAGNPPEHYAWSGYAELCLYLNNTDAYRRHRTMLLKRFGKTTDPPTAERTARACLLLPATGAELEQAVALAERAVELGKKHQYFRFFAVTKALAEYRLDRFESALEWCQKPGTRDVWPSLLVLAMAHQRLGHAEQARQFFDEAVKRYDWKNMKNEWGGIIHSLRREAEALLKIESGVKEPVPQKNSM
jgi:tetratricopeptide (TPR) repeat protein